MTQNTRDILLQAGYDAFMEHGYHGAGLNDILKRAGVPKGSFYHYFKTKEFFLIEVLAFYRKIGGEKMQGFLVDESKPALQQFKAYIESTIAKCNQNDCVGGCLVGNIAQEMSDASEEVRQNIQVCMRAWREGLEQFFVRAQTQGDICQMYDSSELSNMFVDGWQGALLRMKVEKTTEPLHRFLATFLKLLSLKGDQVV